jgi:3-phenylpropionate/cinnamic acid dioxygenase small subunit
MVDDQHFESWLAFYCSCCCARALNWLALKVDG